MSIAGLGASAQSYLTQIFSTQQTGQAGAAQTSLLPGADDSDDAGSDGSNALTGSATGSLSSATLQALLDMVQGDDNSSSASGAATSSQGTHPHHRHHGGAPQTDPAATGSSGTSSSDPTASITELAPGDTGGSSDSLESIFFG